MEFKTITASIVKITFLLNSQTECGVSKQSLKMEITLRLSEIEKLHLFHSELIK